MKIAVIGSINIDMTVTAERIPKKGETLHGDSVSYIPGGKGANQAVAMAKLGAEVEMFGCVGDDSNGERMLENLRNAGIKTEHIRTVKGVPTGIAIITVGENDNTIVVVAGANGYVDRAYIDSVKEMRHSDGTDGPDPAPAAAVPMEIIEKAAYLTPNEHEAVLIFGDELTTEELLKKYPEKLVITQGSRGVSACSASGEVFTVPARKTRVVDTTGAGDTLNGAFAVRIASGDGLKAALIYANTAASLSTEKFGAQAGMPTAEEVEKELGGYEK